jgi:iron complex transport system substrate-binding protein
VSLVCAATDVLDALGVLDRVVAVEEDCPCAGAQRIADRVVRIRNDDHPGKATAFSAEAVMALRPDLVIAKPDLRAALDGRGLRVAWAPTSLGYANTDDLVLPLGEALAMPGPAQALLDRMRVRAEALRARTAGLPRTSVYYETTGVGRSVGSASVLHAMIELAGGRNVAGDVEKPYVTLTAEAILAADPEVLILGPFADPVEDVVRRPGWDRLRAVRSGRIHRIPADDRVVTLASPRCVDAAERMLLPWLHPESAR